MRPSERHLIAIYRLTHGAVTPNDFYDLPRFYSKRPPPELDGAGGGPDPGGQMDKTARRPTIARKPRAAPLTCKVRPA